MVSGIGERIIHNQPPTGPDPAHASHVQTHLRLENEMATNLQMIGMKIMVHQHEYLDLLCGLDLGEKHRSTSVCQEQDRRKL
jgi:hypothetical protein